MTDKGEFKEIHCIIDEDEIAKKKEAKYAAMPSPALWNELLYITHALYEQNKDTFPAKFSGVFPAIVRNAVGREGPVAAFRFFLSSREFLEGTTSVCAQHLQEMTMGDKPKESKDND